MPGSSLADACLLWSAVIALLCAGLTACGPSEGEPSPNDPDAVEWMPLFNGENLDGWTPKITGYVPGDNAGNTFRVEDGLLKVRYDEYDRFDDRYGHLVSDQAFSHYIVAVEYRFAGEQVRGGPGWAEENSGIMVHAQPAEAMTRDQDFPVSIEVQLLGAAGSDERPTANLCTPGTHVEMDGELVTEHCISSRAATYPGEEWVRVEALVLGDSLVEHRVNGEPVLRYTKPQVGGGQVAHANAAVKRDGALLAEGYIALQSESHPIDFRKVELLNLKGCTDPEAINYKSYYVAADSAACRYD